MHDATAVFAALEEAPVVQVPVESLVLAESPRGSGLNTEHAALLAEAAADLPPIIVHRRTMRVLDGAHRCAAARMRGETSIRARLFDAGEDTAFVVAVGANSTHGLPLTLTDRKRAAERILATHPGWSDRTIAAVTSLSDKTVGVLRGRCGDSTPARRGQDGRVRPVDAAGGRRRAAEFLTRHPRASLREIARAADISPGTARDVRKRMQLGEAVVPEPRRSGSSLARVHPAPARGAGTAERASPARPAGAALAQLRNDPSLRFSEAGRALLRLLEAHRPGDGRLAQLIEQVPPHCAAAVAELATHCGRTWLALADRLRERLRSST